MPEAIDLRFINQLAIEEGRRLQSPQTSYIHYYYHHPEGPHHGIPMKENSLFCLALLRSKTAEQVREAIEILQGLLAFQHPDGNFPLYLHEYPKAQDRLLAIQVLPILVWIHKLFSRVLGKEINQLLANSIERALDYSHAVMQEVQLPYHFQALLASVACSQKREWGKDLWQDVLQQSTQTAWFQPTILGDLLVAYRLWKQAEPSGSWPELWEHLAQTWHRPTGNYCGPCIELYQWQEEAETTLYDLTMAYLTQSFPKRLLMPHVSLLQASLIQPFDEKLEEPSLPLKKRGVFEGRKWFLSQHAGWAAAAIERTSHESVGRIRGFHPFRLIWGNKEQSCSLVCQGGKGPLSFEQESEEEIVLKADLVEEFKEYDRRRERELNIFISKKPSMKWSVDGEACTAFRPGEKLTCSQGGFEIQLETEMPEAQSYGHIQPGNREAQRACRGDECHAVHDWQCFLRTIHRSQPCQATMRVKWREEDIPNAIEK